MCLAAIAWLVSETIGYLNLMKNYQASDTMAI
jgi:hypothetical protein